MLGYSIEGRCEQERSSSFFVSSDAGEEEPPAMDCGDATSLESSREIQCRAHFSVFLFERCWNSHLRRSAATSKRKAISRSRLVKTPLQHVVVLRKLRRLKKLVPGCCRSTAIGLEELLRRTAEYISFLELKVILLKRTIMGINKLK